jgi:hypothetical protein
MTEIGLLSEDSKLRKDIIDLTTLKYNELPKQVKFARTPREWYMDIGNGNKYFYCSYNFWTNEIWIGDNFYDTNINHTNNLPDKVYRSLCINHEIQHYLDLHDIKIISQLSPEFNKMSKNEDLYLSKYSKSSRQAYLDFKDDYKLLEGRAEYYSINKLPKRYRDLCIDIYLDKINRINEFPPIRKVYLEGLRDQFIKHGVIK